MERNEKIVKTSFLGIIVNIVLVVFKATVGIIVNSIAIILDAVNNLSDALSSIITIIGTKLSEKAPDKKHPYGHGRIEYFTSIIIAILVLAAGVTALKESVEKVINPEVANYSVASLIIVAVAVLVKFFFGRYVKKVGEKLNSQSLVASGTDALMDSILSLSTFVAAIISIMWNISLEGILGVIIALFIIKSSIDILKETITIMIGIRADSELTNRLKARIIQFDEVQGVYDLDLHSYGPSKMVGSVHIQVRDDMTAKEIHKLTRTITMTILQEFGIILTIGVYAANDKGEFGEIKETLGSIIKDYKEIIQMHGFYVDEDTKNIFFDLIIDFKADKPDEIQHMVIDKIKEKYPNYNYNVILDLDISD